MDELIVTSTNWPIYLGRDKLELGSIGYKCYFNECEAQQKRSDSTHKRQSKLVVVI